MPIQKFHKEFDLEHWKNLFPLSSFAESDYLYPLDGRFITGPVDLIGTLLGREMQKIPEEFNDTVPCDIFVFGLRQPHRPFLTQIGGIPYRSADKEWPTYKGKPMVFASQICFSDSRDILPFDLPGDVLLVFVAEEWVEEIHFEWSHVGEVRNIIPIEEIPEEGWLRASWEHEKVCFYGEIFRCHDYPNAYNIFHKYEYPERFSNKLAILEGTKIGGAKVQFGYESLDDNFALRNPGYEMLCRIGSILPCSVMPYSFINFAGSFPLLGPSISDHYTLLWGDAGGIVVYMNKEGDLLWEFHCG